MREVMHVEQLRRPDHSRRISASRNAHIDERNRCETTPYEKTAYDISDTETRAQRCTMWPTVRPQRAPSAKAMVLDQKSVSQLPSMPERSRARSRGSTEAVGVASSSLRSYPSAVPCIATARRRRFEASLLKTYRRV